MFRFRHYHAVFRLRQTSIRTMLTVLHVVSTVIAYSAFGLSYFVLPRTTNVGTEKIAAVATIITFSAVASLSGLGLLVVKRDKPENIVFAVSTVAAFLLFVLAV